MTRYLDVRAVVLGSRPLGEADRIVVLFTREAGRLDAVVKGVRKTKSKWGGRLEPFNVCDLMLFRGRSLATVTSAELVAMFPRLRQDREAMIAAALVCEIAANIFPEEEPHDRVFNLICRSLRTFDQGFTGRALEAPVMLGALIKLLHEAGFLPVLDGCACCGGGEQAVAFSASRGGLVCGDCSGEGLPASGAAVEALCDALEATLADLRTAEPSPAVAEAVRHLNALVAFQTGTRLRSLRFAGAG